MMDHWILDEKHDPVAVDLMTWGRWTNVIENKRVAYDELPSGHRVSTVFLGIDHSFGDGPPLLFETMVFPPDSYSDLECDRYSTWDQAVAGHAETLARWKKREANDD